MGLFDGSGRVQRSKSQYELALFLNGKQYDTDLAASYNISARYLADQLKLTRRKDGQGSERQKFLRYAEQAGHPLSAMGLESRL